MVFIVPMHHYKPNIIYLIQLVVKKFDFFMLMIAVCIFS